LGFAVAFVLVFSVFVAASRRIRRIALAAAVLGGVAFGALFYGLAYDHREYRDPETWAIAWHHVLAHTVLYVAAFTSVISVPWLLGSLGSSMRSRGAKRAA
jgi:hypothetical protein